MNSPPVDPDVALAQIVHACRKEAPELPDSVIASAALLAGGAKARTRFARELALKPDLLTSGRSDASPTAYRLIKDLRARGYENIQLPRCSSCGLAKNLPHRDGQGGKRCGSCNRPATTPDCTSCHQVRRGGHRMIDGKPYCAPCWRRDPRSREICSICARPGTAVVRSTSGPVCKGCYTSPSTACSHCGEIRPTMTRKEDTPLCMRCYQSLRKRPRTCSRCGEYRIAPYLRQEGPVCPHCANQFDLGQCAGCGNDQRPLQGNYCTICVAPRLLRILISDDEGTTHPQLRALEHYLLRNPENADAVISWIRRSPMARVVHDMATGHAPISLRAIAEHRAGGATGYLAALLMESGVVPTENFDRIRLEVWEEEYFAALPNPANRSLLKQYAAWIVNPRFVDAAHLGTTDESLRHRQSKAHLIAVCNLLDTLNDRGLDLGTVPQRTFDDYVATRGRAGKQLTPFIRWAGAQGLTRLRSEYLKSSLGTSGATEDERWAWAKDLFTSEDLRLEVRVGGLLAIIYGTALTRVVSLRRDAVTLEDDTIYLSLGTEPIKLPSALGALLRRLLDSGTTSGRESNIWIFKGRRAGRHLTTATIRGPLARRGISLRAARNVALMSLARDLPPSVLAELLGISVYAAERWSAHSGHDWTDYPRVRLTTGPI